MRNLSVIFAAVASVILVSGCRFKGVESFEKATTPVDYAKQNVENGVKGDPYANGGIAYASAGKKTHTRYGLGADAQSTGKVDPMLDRPAKGSGQQPGEQGGEAAAGHGQSNAPANQPGPLVDSSSSH